MQAFRYGQPRGSSNSVIDNERVHDGVIDLCSFKRHTCDDMPIDRAEPLMPSLPPVPRSVLLDGRNLGDRSGHQSPRRHLQGNA
jgi:hypothetical protein